MTQDNGGLPAIAVRSGPVTASGAAEPGPYPDGGAGHGPDGGNVAVLFRRHHADLVRLAVLLVGDVPTAEDVVQDVYGRLHVRRGRVPDAPAAFLAYARQAVVNGCRSVLRRRATRQRLGPLLVSVPGSEQESAEQHALLAEDRRQVLTALAALPARRREVLVLRYFLDLSEAEIAAVLGISAGAVKSSASRGLAALARQIGEQA
jgi:RNA polymerase sigma-70 factor (sigma-E family)